MATRFLQINPKGTNDKANQEVAEGMLDPEHAASWEASPNHSIIQNFQKILPNPDIVDSPRTQTRLFDIDNMVKGQSGIYRQMQDGLSTFGSDMDGKPLYAFNDLANNKDYDLGKNKLYTTGALMQGLGAFDNEEEADTFAKFTANAGDPKFMGAIAGLSATGDKKGAVNLIMKEFGHPDLDNIDSSEDKRRAYGTAFSAYNFVENVEKMSPAQQSLTLSTLGLINYKFKDGTTISDRAIVKDPEGKTAFSLGEAMQLGSSGYDIASMQKNWDQLNLVQNVSFGKGSPSQLAATGKRLQLLGDPALGGSAVYQSEAELGRIGFTSVPSAGMGAITGSSDALPSNYEVIGAGEKPGQVIAVPKGLSYSTGTLNGTSEIRSLNSADGVKPASIGAFKTYANQLPNKSSGSLRGTSFAAGLGQSGILQDPYMSSALATASVYGNTINKLSPEEAAEHLTELQNRQAQAREQLQTRGAKGPSTIQTGISAGKAVTTIGEKTGLIDAGPAAVASGALNVGSVLASDMSDKDKGREAYQQGENAVAAYATGGASALAQQVDQRFLGGKVEKARDSNAGQAAMAVANPYGFAISKGIEYGMKAFGGGFGGGKGKDQKARDSVRKVVVNSGLINGDEWTVALADGTTADVGKDGKGGRHDFRNINEAVGGAKYLNAYDVDYSNDLDFSSNMMTNALMRMVAGGKGAPIDQIGGQLGNAALGKVGYGADMNEETFNYVRDNVRGFYFKQGIQTKEDAYALSNQMFAEGRIAETDVVAMQQGINMTFDENGYDNAQVLMSGRRKGVETAVEMPHSPGPNYSMQSVKKPLTISTEGQSDISGERSGELISELPIPEEEHELQMNPGTYGGNSNTDIFTKSIIKYQDPWSMRNGNESR